MPRCRASFRISCAARCSRSPANGGSVAGVIDRGGAPSPTSFEFHRRGAGVRFRAPPAIPSVEVNPPFLNAPWEVTECVLAVRSAIRNRIDRWVDVDGLSAVDRVVAGSTPARGVCPGSSVAERVKPRRRTLSTGLGSAGADSPNNRCSSRGPIGIGSRLVERVTRGVQLPISTDANDLPAAPGLWGEWRVGVAGLSHHNRHGRSAERATRHPAARLILHTPRSLGLGYAPASSGSGVSTAASTTQLPSCSTR